MAWPAPGSTVASYDKTANTRGRTVDPILWPMLCAKSQLIDRIAKESTESIKFEWESANTNARTFTAAATSTASQGIGYGGTSGASTGHATNTKLGCGSGGGLTVQKGAIIRLSSQASPIGTYEVDEIMQVTANDLTDITVKRDYARQNSGTGSTAHFPTGVYEVLWSPKEEGSSPDANKYKDVSLFENYVNTIDFHLNVTGDQLADKRMVAGDTLQRQFDDRLVELKNDMESMLLYGALNYGGAGTEADAYGGSDAYVRTTKGLQNFIAASGGNVDYTSHIVTEESINALMMTLLTNGVDMTDKFILVSHPATIRTINAFGADKVRITQDMTKWGRALKSLETDLGVELELVPCLNCSKSDMFIVDTKKVKLMEFRPFVKMEWGIDTSTPTGVDVWNQRYLGSYGVKVTDGTKSHGLQSAITW
jgi:hypothetical protein